MSGGAEGAAKGGGDAAEVPQVAMVMAAGRGTRMRELTRGTPKPLLRAGGRTLLDHALDRVAEAGVPRAVVNIHYLGGMIRDHLAARARPEIAISDEREALLDTGGGVRKALPLLGEGPAFVLNGDAVWTGAAPLPALLRAWDPGRMDALLLLVPRGRARGYTRPGDFFLDPDGRPRRRGGAQSAPYVYTGAQIVRAGAFAEGPEGAFSTNLVWDRMLAEGRLFAALHDGDWVDVGTPEGLAEAEAALAGRAA